MPIVTVGSIGDMESAERIVAEGKADIVAMARAIPADPETVDRARHGRLEDIRPCLRRHTCNRLTAAFYPIRCAVNPVLGREPDYVPLPPARTKKKIVVGPAGIQAALKASERGARGGALRKERQAGRERRARCGPPHQGRHEAIPRVAPAAGAESARCARQAQYRRDRRGSAGLRNSSV